jgi:hypothetical protein
MTPPVYDKPSFNELILEPTLFWIDKLTRLWDWAKSLFIKTPTNTDLET